LVNLVGNAIKFTARGEVVIEARTVAASDSHLTVRLSVRDTGIGIPLDRQAAVFESFTQADGSTTRTHGGTGLGLAISKQLVQLMGGTIGLQSTPGVGSTFWIELPFERENATTMPGRTVPAQLVQLRVLIVDDTPINRRILRRTLEAWGCRVTEAAGGGEALARLEASAGGERFGLVLLDLDMPDLDGIETARRLRAHPQLANLPVILLSSVGGLHTGDRAASEVGFAAIVTKPVRQEVLLDRVLRAVCQATPDADQPSLPPAAVVEDTLALRVLLAEDNRVNQIVAQRLLEKLGCRFDIVANGRDAAQAAARNAYDAVLMDVQMPVMDGLEATVVIRRSEAARGRTWIIATTAHAMDGDRERCLAAGMDDYITKPLSLAAVRAALLRVPRAAPLESPAPVRTPGAEPSPGTPAARSA
jgi:CheY-like chemotaxis protein